MDPAPSVHLEPLNDPISPLDLTPNLASLLDLARRGSWRSILDSAAPPPDASLLPHQRLALLSFSIFALLRLRRYSHANSALQDIDFSSPDHLFQSYPNLYPDLSGSMIPFSLRFMSCILPIKLGDKSLGLDRLYCLLDFARSRICDAKEANGADSVSLAIWRRREVVVVGAILAVHLGNKDFGVCLDLIKALLDDGYEEDPILVSKLGYIQMQIGDVAGAKCSFSKVEELASKQEDNKEVKNLAGRDKALVHLVAKDYISAVREYEACIERDGNDVVAINNKALCLMYLRDLSDSIKVLEGSLERAPTVSLNETLVVNLCSMYELAYINHSEIKKTLSNWIVQVAPDDFDSSCTRI
ncbi:hypothetical protein MLD38_028780 [Melastoma candidum]|uniref:Uncharacterized protein n=1 Tax=Melastoma candidum TaxID=119954 RepID=A0ACB9N2V9_9MYRT|nr:hypothetical protein MLD38_028780 [Melastoma candidum]